MQCLGVEAASLGIVDRSLFLSSSLFLVAARLDSSGHIKARKLKLWQADVECLGSVFISIVGYVAMSFGVLHIRNTRD